MLHSKFKDIDQEERQVNITVKSCSQKDSKTDLDPVGKPTHSKTTVVVWYGRKRKGDRSGIVSRSNRENLLLPVIYGVTNPDL